MIATTNSTEGGTQTEAYEVLPCSPSSVVGLQPQSIYFSAVNIFLSITAFLGNFLILVALNRESSLHPPSKLLYRCLATTDLLVGLVSQPLFATYWMSGSRTLESLSIHKGRNLHIKLCIMWGVFVDVDGHKRGQTSRSVVGNKIQTNSYFKAHIYHYHYFLDFIRRLCIIFRFAYSNKHLVWYYSYTFMLGDFNCLVHKDISHS